MIKDDYANKIKELNTELRKKNAGIKAKNIIIKMLLIGFIIINGCSDKLSDEDLLITQNHLVSTILAGTSVFETSVVVLLTERAPTSTLTVTPSPTITETLAPSITPKMTLTVFRDPWVFQDICLTDPTSCVKYSVNNRLLKFWIQVEMLNQETGESANFSVAPKGIGIITLVPGYYKATFMGDCPGNIPASSIVSTGYINGGESSGPFRCSLGRLAR